MLVALPVAADDVVALLLQPLRQVRGDEAAGACRDATSALFSVAAAACARSASSAPVMQMRSFFTGQYGWAPYTVFTASPAAAIAPTLLVQKER
jgi:hypothetical protein